MVSPSPFAARALRRSVVVQMPITGLVVESLLPASTPLGSWRATLFTLYPARVSVTTSERSPP